MFKYLIASLLSSTPKTILSVYIPDFFIVCVCVYKCFIETAAESERCRRGVRDVYLGKRILAKEKCISTEKKE